MNQESFFKNFQLLVDAHNGVQKLRELILQMAIHGNLITQDLNEESVFKQLEKIKSDKNQLIQKRKLKLRNISENNDVNILKYKIPSNWCWFRLPEVVFFQEGPGIRNWQFKSHGIKLLNVQNILPNNKTLFEKSDKYVSEEEVNEKYEHFLIEEGDLLFAASGGSWGKSAWFYDPGYKIMLNTSTIRLKFFSDEFEPNYLKYFLDSSFFKKQMELQLVGMQPNFGSTHLGRVYIPIPPLEEQKRIVAKADQLMALCEELEARQQKKQEQRIRLNNAALDKLLTAPTPEEFAQHWQRICDDFNLLYDAPETVLLEEIKSEKKQLVKDKKIRKVKPLPPIKENEISYKLPDKWEWARLGDALLKITDGTHHSPPNGPKGEFKYITAKNIKSGGINLSNITYVSKAMHEEIYNRCDPESGDILYIKDGATTGIVTINELNEQFSMLSSVALLKNPSKIYNRYLLYVLRSPYFYSLMRDDMSGVAITRVTLTKLNRALIPLAPFEEQKRIVAKVDQLMALCNELEAGLAQAQTEGGKLMEAVVHHVLAA